MIYALHQSHAQSRQAIDRISHLTGRPPRRAEPSAADFYFLSIFFTFSSLLWSNYHITLANSHEVSHGRVSIRELAQCVVVQPCDGEQATQHNDDNYYHGNIPLFPYQKARLAVAQTCRLCDKVPCSHSTVTKTGTRSESTYSMARPRQGTKQCPRTYTSR